MTVTAKSAVVQAAILRAERFINDIDGLLDRLTMPQTQRIAAAGSLLDLATEHQKAIILMVSHGLVGSALTMFRPAFEAYAHGSHRSGAAAAAALCSGGFRQLWLGGRRASDVG